MEEYRRAVQKLKLQADELEKQNIQLQTKLGIAPSEELRVPQFAKILSQQTSKLYIREQVIKELFKCCSERGMTLEMIFRCADQDLKNQLTVQQLRDFLDYFFFRQIDSQTLIQVALLFDDDCSGLILREEFYRVCIYCKCDSEQQQHVLTANTIIQEDPKDIQLKVIEKFIKYLRDIKNSPQGIAQQIDYAQKGFITGDDLSIGLGNKGFASNEIFILLKYFDIKGQNKIRLSDFIDDLKDMLNSKRTAEQLISMRKNNVGLSVLLEMRKFRATLQQQSVDPLLVFYQCQPKDQYRKSITDLAISFSRQLKGISFDQIMEWMRLIDTSGDQSIDQDEFKMAIMIEGDMGLQAFKTQKQDDDVSLIGLVLEKINKKQVTLEQFFDWMDTDNSQTINLIELRKGFVALNIDIGIVLKLVAWFDKNGTGIIDICEFYEAFGQEHKEETDAIILKKAVRKINQYYVSVKSDFVSGMKKLLFGYNQTMTVISCEEFLFAMEKIKDKSSLSDGEIYKMMEKGLSGQKSINLTPLCNYLYSLI